MLVLAQVAGFLGVLIIELGVRSSHEVTSSDR